MRILLRARPWLLSSHPTQNRTNSSSLRSLTAVDDFIGNSKCYSILTPGSIQNQIHHRNIGTTKTGTEPDGNYIYNGKSTWTMKRLKIYSFAFSIYGIYTQPFLWEKSQLFADTGLAIEDSFFIPGAFAAMLPILIHSRIMNYVTDIRYNKDTDVYTCSILSFFLFKNEIKFKVEDIQETENRTNCIMMKIGPKNIPLILEAASFMESEHYKRILGYDTRTMESIADGESIYKSPHTQSILRSKLFSYAIIFSGVMAQQGLWQLWGMWGCSIGGALMFMWPILTHFRVKNIVHDMRYNKKTDEYTCTTNPIFSMERKIKFKVEDIQNLEAQTIFTTLRVGPKKVPLFIEKSSFTDPSHYARLMGYDKLFDFGKNVNLLENEKQKSIETGNHYQSDESNLTPSELKKKEQQA